MKYEHAISIQEHYYFIFNNGSYFLGKDTDAKYHCTLPERGTGINGVIPKSIFYREYSTESGQNEIQLNTMNAQDVTNIL